MSGFSDVARIHAQLRVDAVALLRAVDARNAIDTVIAFGRFQRCVEAHLSSDASAGYRLLLRSNNTAVRHAASRMLEVRSTFERAFDFFVLRWRVAREDALLSVAFRDEIEAIVTELMKQLLAEERLLALIANVA